MIDTRQHPFSIDIIPENDEQRLEALRRYQILDASPEEALNNLAHLVAGYFKAPIALISLVDKDKVAFKGNVGMPGVKQVERGISLCSLAVLSAEPTIIDNPLEDPCLLANPMVHGKFGLRFYAGAPLITPDGYNIGTVCVVDKQERSFSPKDREALVRFAKMAMQHIELRLAAKKQLAAEAESRQAAQEIRTTNETLSKLSQELQFVTDTVPQLVWATEPNGHAYFFNKRWLEYTGLSFEEIKGEGWAISLHPDDLEGTLAAWRRALDTAGNFDVEYRLKGRDGVYRWFVARGVPMKDSAGNILKWYGSSTEINEQKGIEEALRQSHERFGLVAKATQDAIWDWNLVTNEIWWNEGFRTLFGYKEEDIEPTIDSWYNRVHPEDKERVVGSIHKVIDAGGKQWSDEYRFRKADGTYAIVYDRGYALHDAAGKPWRMLGSMQDITERKAASALLEQRVKERTQELETRNRDLEQFTYVSHHDLQEPLRKIIFFSDMVRGEAGAKLSEVSVKRLDKVTDAARRMSVALRDVLDFASLNKKEPHSLTPLDEVLSAVQLDLEVAIAEKGATIEAGPLPRIPAVAGQMHQLFYNLLNNALKFSRPGVAPVVKIGCIPLDREALSRHPQLNREQSYIRITFQDNGIGFDPAASEKIFGMFQRLHSKEDYAGTGIGLALCKKVVENHGGAIRAEGTPGAGARFIILLPAG